MSEKQYRVAVVGGLGCGVDTTCKRLLSARIAASCWSIHQKGHASLLVTLAW